MNFNPKVSIIIPVYNGSNYLKESIESSLAQTYENIEVIVVNDGSTDCKKTEHLALSFGSKIKYFQKENGGVASALNYGIKEMTGEYFSWLSHDDVYFPSKIERQIDYLNKTNDKQCILYGDFQIIDEDSNYKGVCKISTSLSNNSLLAILSTSIHGCTTLVPKKILNTVSLFNENLKTTQDNDLWFRIFKTGFEFNHIPETIVKSRSHPEQGSIILREFQLKETDMFYLNAIQNIGDELQLICYDLVDILLNKKCFYAYYEFLKIMCRINKKKTLKILLKSLFNFNFFRTIGMYRQYEIR
jgi:glycosyltransferase involved in cell wall biosynthesis